MTEVIQAAAELQSVCQNERWQFAFIGGLALLRWGEPRETVDADLTLLTGLRMICLKGDEPGSDPIRLIANWPKLGRQSTQGRAQCGRFQKINHTLALRRSANARWTFAFVGAGTAVLTLPKCRSQADAFAACALCRTAFRTYSATVSFTPATDTRLDRKVAIKISSAEFRQIARV